MKINELFDPGVKQTKSPVERHHLFPKAYLSSIGITGTTRTNQIANFAFVEWADNDRRSRTRSRPSTSRSTSTGCRRRIRSRRGSCGTCRRLSGNTWTTSSSSASAARRLAKRRGGRGSSSLRAGAAHEAAARSAAPRRCPPCRTCSARWRRSRVEFKQSRSRRRSRTTRPERVINEGVVKTVAAFLNSHPAGPSASASPTTATSWGLQPDLDFKHQDLDGYQNWLTTLLGSQHRRLGWWARTLALQASSRSGRRSCASSTCSRAPGAGVRIDDAGRCRASTSGSTTRRGCSTGRTFASYIDGHWPK